MHVGCSCPRQRVLVNASASAMVLATLSRLVDPLTAGLRARSDRLQLRASVALWSSWRWQPPLLPCQEWPGVALAHTCLGCCAHICVRGHPRELLAFRVIHASCVAKGSNVCGLYTMAGRHLSASTLLSGLSWNARRPLRVALNVACVHVGSSSQADYHKRNSAMDDSIGGS